MAVIGNTNPTLLEVSKLYTGDGTPLPVAELLTEQNPILDDIPWFESNQTTGERLAVRTGLPEAVYRKLNAGIPASKSRYADVTESTGMLTSLGKVDKALADLAPNSADFRVRENMGHFTAMNQTFANRLFYGDTDVSPQEFLGFAPRFSEADETKAENAVQLIDGGGTGTDNASIWLIGWGKEGAYGIYPKGSKAGLIHEDYGVELVKDADGNEFPAYRDWFEWHHGIAVKDWRNIVRVANVDVTTLTKNASAGADLIDLMVQAVEQINAPDAVKLAFYVPRSVRSFLRRQITNKDNVWLSMGEVAGRKATLFDGIPVRRVDALYTNEAEIQFP